MINRTSKTINISILIIICFLSNNCTKHSKYRRDIIKDPIQLHLEIIQSSELSLNKINPISPKNPKRQKYIDAAKELEN